MDLILPPRQNCLALAAIPELQFWLIVEMSRNGQQDRQPARRLNESSELTIISLFKLNIQNFQYISQIPSHPFCVRFVTEISSLILLIVACVLSRFGLQANLAQA